MKVWISYNMAVLLIAIIYLCFISLGLPDSLLGAAWPSIHQSLNLDSSLVSIIALVITLFTTISALFTPKVVKVLTTKWVAIFSIVLTIVGLIGFSFCSQFYMFFIFALPYGLGAGAIDAALNAYVAKHYSARVMNFLHCFYGLGAIISPNIMALAITYTHWNDGFLWTSFIQMGILVAVIASIPLWKINIKEDKEEEKEQLIPFKEAFKIKGVIFALISFFAYCSAEGIVFLYTSSFFESIHPYLSKEITAAFGSLVFFGLMIGRIVAGILSSKIDDRKMVRYSFLIEVVGIVLIAIPIKNAIPSAIGFVILGIGMGPIYPALQHIAPINFGKKASSTVIALQMACAYTGFTFFPVIFGFAQQYISMWLLPIFVFVLLLSNIIFMEISCKEAIKNDGINRI